MKMKVIDLLNKIANGEKTPKKIYYNNQYWTNNYPNDYEGLSNGGCLLSIICLDALNDEVEIIEEEPEIDIQGIKEVEIGDIANLDGQAPFREKNKINELIRAIKQIDKKLKGE